MEEGTTLLSNSDAVPQNEDTKPSTQNNLTIATAVTLLVGVITLVSLTTCLVLFSTFSATIKGNTSINLTPVPSSDNHVMPCAYKLDSLSCDTASCAPGYLCVESQYGVTCDLVESLCLDKGYCLDFFSQLEETSAGRLFNLNYSSTSVIVSYIILSIEMIGFVILAIVVIIAYKKRFFERFLEQQSIEDRSDTESLVTLSLNNHSRNVIDTSEFLDSSAQNWSNQDKVVILILVSLGFLFAFATFSGIFFSATSIEPTLPVLDDLRYSNCLHSNLLDIICPCIVLALVFSVISALLIGLYAILLVSLLVIRTHQAVWKLVPCISVTVLIVVSIAFLLIVTSIILIS